MVGCTPSIGGIRVGRPDVGRSAAGWRQCWLAGRLPESVINPQLSSGRSARLSWPAIEVITAHGAATARSRGSWPFIGRIVIASRMRRSRRGIPVTMPDRELSSTSPPGLPMPQLEAGGQSRPTSLASWILSGCAHALEWMTRQRGVLALRRLLDRRVFRLTDSELERRFLRLVSSAALPKPETGSRDQRLPRGLLLARVGARASRRTACRYHRTPSQQARDRRRDQIHAAAGLTTLRFTHAQVRFEPGYVRRRCVASSPVWRGSLAATRPSLSPCAGGTRSPIPIRGCCGFGSGCASRPRSSRRRATTSRRPIRCWRFGSMRRERGSRGSCAGD